MLTYGCYPQCHEAGMALPAISQARKTGLESLGACLWSHRLWQQSVDSLPRIAPLGLYFKPWCPARHEECTEVNCFYLGPLYSVQEFLQCLPITKRRGHRSPQGPGHMLTYIHLSFFYLPGVASQSQAPKSGEELHFCSRH